MIMAQEQNIHEVVKKFEKAFLGFTGSDKGKRLFDKV